MERSARRRQICLFITQFRKRKGYSPSIRDVCKGVGIKSTSNVWYHFLTMKRDGFLRWDQGVSRSVVVVTRVQTKSQSRRGALQGHESPKGNAE